MTDDEIKFIQKLEEACHFFSRKGNPNRERFVVVEFLNKIGENFNEDQIKNIDEEGLIDVVYQTKNESAKFEIKVIHNFLTTEKGEEVELLTASFKKVNEIIKKCYNDDVFYGEEIANALNFQFKDRTFIKNYKDGYQFLISYIKDTSIKYSERLNELADVDLLIYSIRTNLCNIVKSKINSQDFNQYGWRSVSYVDSNVAYVLYASKTAPIFLKERVVK